jgi:hypothetical protein
MRRASIFLIIFSALMIFSGERSDAVIIFPGTECPHDSEDNKPIAAPGWHRINLTSGRTFSAPDGFIVDTVCIDYGRYIRNYTSDISQHCLLIEGLGTSRVTATNTDQCTGKFQSISFHTIPEVDPTVTPYPTPTDTPVPTPSLSPTHTPSPTATPIGGLVTSTPTPEPSLSPTSSPTVVPTTTETPVPTTPTPTKGSVHGATVLPDTNAPTNVLNLILLCVGLLSGGAGFWIRANILKQSL